MLALQQRLRHAGDMASRADDGVPCPRGTLSISARKLSGRAAFSWRRIQGRKSSFA
jgi:hypothetical protein